MEHMDRKEGCIKEDQNILHISSLTEKEFEDETKEDYQKILHNSGHERKQLEDEKKEEDQPCHPQGGYACGTTSPRRTGKRRASCGC